MLRLPLLVEFCLCAALVVLAGTRLSRYGNWIGEATGLSGAWIGMALLAAATSLPELATAVGTVVAIGGREGADLAFGDLFGSCAFNLLIIVLLDLLSPKVSPLDLGRRGQVLTAAGGAVMLVVAGVGLVVTRASGGVLHGFGWIFSLILFGSYFAMVRMSFNYERAHPDERDKVEQLPHRGSRGGLYVQFLLAAALIVVSGLWLAEIGEALATVKFGAGAAAFTLGESFVGTLFLAVATSLPEVVVTVAAFRIGAVNMGLGNLFGSNVFNVAIIPVCDAFAGGRLFAHGSTRNLIPLGLAVVMTAVTIVSLLRPVKRRAGRLGWDSALLLVLYVAGMIALFRSGGH
jgi:cation:H+ antiporter